jgi:hypothetical protein
MNFKTFKSSDEQSTYFDWRQMVYNSYGLCVTTEIQWGLQPEWFISVIGNSVCACCFCVYSMELRRGRDFPTLFWRLLRDCSSLFLFKHSHKPLRHLTHNGPYSHSIVMRGNNLFTIEPWTLRVRGGKTFFFSHNQPALLNNWWAGMSNLRNRLFFTRKYIIESSQATYYARIAQF